MIQIILSQFYHWVLHVSFISCSLVDIIILDSSIEAISERFAYSSVQCSHRDVNKPSLGLLSAQFSAIQQTRELLLIMSSQLWMNLQFIYFIFSVHSGQTDSASSTFSQAQPHPGCQNHTAHAASTPEQAKDEAPAP